MGHDGPFHLGIADGKPILRGLGLYHGKRGCGVSVEAHVKLGPVTLLALTQTADGRLKLLDFADLSHKFPDPLGVGSTASLVLALFAEVVCSGLLVLGLVTRLAALSAAITMGVAFFLVHKASLEMGSHSGELAFIYLAGFVTLVIAGPGVLSADACLQRTRATQKGVTA